MNEELLLPHSGGGHPDPLSVPLSGALHPTLATTASEIRLQPLEEPTWATRCFAFLIHLRKREEFPEQQQFTRRWALTAGRLVLICWVCIKRKEMKKLVPDVKGK